MNILRGHMLCRELRWRMPAEEFRKRNYGWSRTEIVGDLMKEIGIGADTIGSIQVIPAGRYYWIVITSR